MPENPNKGLGQPHNPQEPNKNTTEDGVGPNPQRRTGNSAFASLDYRRPKYPHDTHPVLVPGIPIDEQRRRYRIDRLVFAIAGSLTVAFVAWGIWSPQNVAAVSETAFFWATDNLGWMFNAVAIIVLASTVGIALSRYGRIPLGKDGEKPEFSTFSWVAMLFAAGLGVAVLFWGPSEPLGYFISPPPMTEEPESTEALHTAMAQMYFHWGFHAWAFYALVGGAVAYAAYRRGRSLLMSSIFRALFGQRLTEGFAGKLVDVFAIIATLFGTAAALGIAAMQIGAGVTIVSGAGELTNSALVVIIAILTVAFVVSAVSGVARGIRYLSNINIVLTIGMIAIVFFAGPSLFLLNLLPSAVMEYIGSLFDMMGRSLSWGGETQEFQSTWTVYYWAWWISWSPFVGIFLARISRGRSIRQFTLGTILIPSSLLFIAYAVMGGTSIWMYRDGAEGLGADTPPPEVLFSVIGNLPYIGWLPYVVIVVLAIFFVTAADSASVVMGMLTTQGDQKPRRWVVVFWGLVMSGIAIVMLLLGDAMALEGLQQLVIVTAVPFALILVAAIVAWFKELRTDPLALRMRYVETAVNNAVTEGVERYGDDFSLKVVESRPGNGAGADIDSTDESYTEWYRRTNEEGEPVDYDFGTGEWADGYDAATGEICEPAAEPGPETGAEPEPVTGAGPDTDPDTGAERERR